jgi:hypothetical protein
VVSLVVSQVRLSKVLVNGGSSLNFIVSKTLESMGHDMTSSVPTEEAFYGIIPGLGLTPVGQVTLPITFKT